MNKKIVLGVLLSNRTSTATKFQEVITKFGCNIKTRLGLHDVEGNKCSTSGIILLELHGETEDLKNMEAEIKAIDGSQVQKMEFDV